MTWPASGKKVHEELDELKEAVASGNKGHAQEELGDLLFTLVNVARWCQIEPEEGPRRHESALPRPLSPALKPP
jgi:NTP pyrophosphatase (non-canonical NTP hydrolase)